MRNSNTVYANCFVDALVAAGLKRVCLTPGSRHTPLVLAFARHRGRIQLYSHLDERSAAFFALGMALAADEPVALACTSGSAAANFFPAIVEASQSRLPLLILTGDRPHELRGSGANQTIDQVKIYGDYARFFVDLPLPEAHPPALALRNLRSLAARALAMTTEGPAHINLPFRKPFEPGADDELAIDRRASPRIMSPGPPRPLALDALLPLEALSRKGLIYCGHGSCRTTADADHAARFAAGLSRISGFPVLAEATSGLRFAAGDHQPLSAYESWAGADGMDLDSVETIIRFGAPPLSNVMGDILARAQLAHHIVISRDWSDDTHSATRHISLTPASLGATILPDLQPPAANLAFRERLLAADAIARQVIQREIETGDYFDGAAVNDVVDLLPAGAAIFAGSSLPVRQLDQFGHAGHKRLQVFANRGASGIDGNISTALGIGAAGGGRPLVAIVGDITFYHDMNGLLAARRLGLPVTIALLNNGGGGIFQRLPMRGIEPEFSDYFITDPQLDFSHAAALYSLDYTRVHDRGDFRSAFSESISRPGRGIIEVRSDARGDLRRRAEIMAAVQERLRKLKPS